MKRRGQAIFGMSFGTIFSIILIIAIVFVAFFAIRHFLKINSCTQIGFFYDDLEEKVETIWISGGAQDSFEGNLPTSGVFGADITYVCFGDPSKATGDDKPLAEEIMIRAPTDSNVYMYPPEEACIPHKNVRCRGDKSDCIITDPEFFCVKTPQSGTLTLDLYLKTGGGGPVTIRPN